MVSWTRLKATTIPQYSQALSTGSDNELSETDDQIWQRHLVSPTMQYGESSGLTDVVVLLS